VRMMVAVSHEIIVTATRVNFHRRSGCAPPFPTS